MGKSYEDMTVAELKERLRKKNLPLGGNKKDLISRLRGNSKASKKGSKQSIKGDERVPANVLDKELYIKVRNKVKQRVKVSPSAYASGQVVTEYKKAGGRYSGKKGSKDSAPLDRWYKEKWVNVCKSKRSGYEPCGRAQSKVKDYPYCRPSVRVTSATPMTVGELTKKYGKKKLDELCQKKRSKALPKKGKALRIRPKETRRNK